jgi:ribulose-5-phosphate 4-epimerase/fuculose-1-phosphate aldolase
MCKQVDQSETEHSNRVEICKIGQQMYERGYVIACEGNLSVRLDGDRILVTPSGACKGDLAPQDLLVVDLEGAVTCGTGQPSSEMQMHLLYYRSRPDVRAVCHGHPPAATGFAVAGRALEEAILPEVVISLGKVPLAPYGTPGTLELCAGLEPLVFKHDAILLENHGVVTSGKDLITAYYHMETVERLTPLVRSRAKYRTSLQVLRRAKELSPNMVTKSGVMLGLGEKEPELFQTMDDLREIGCQVLTMGQYLRPTPNHLPVVEYIAPEQFDFYGNIARNKGFDHVASGPLVRSSYHAADFHPVVR